MFNFLVWKAREAIKDGKEAAAGVTERILRSTLHRVSWLTPVTLTDEQLPGNKITAEEKDRCASRVRSYGASGKRTPAQKAAAVAAASKIQAGLPDDAITVWTDGSRIGKEIPGPSGAGAIIMEQKAIQQELTYYLGDSTNQAAELWAIGGALETLSETNTGDREVHVFTDSQFSKDCLEGRYFSAKHYHRVAKARKIARTIKGGVHYHHVAGHAGIPGNERADKLANAGALYSKQNVHFEELNLDEILEHYTFNYLKIDGIT
jgi:ribonuclease HI